MIFIYIITATLIISTISFIGVLTLIFNKDLLNRILLGLVSFSAGALLGGAFFHLLPESIEEIGPSINIFIALIFGFCLFFILEQFIHWHHNHKCKGCKKVAPFSYLVLISDGIHNFLDGFIIAASFIVAFPVGVATTIAVALHEIPQEIGDFGVLIYGGMRRKKALLLNFFSGLVAVVGGIVGFLLSNSLGESVIYLLPFAAGNFIYIASSDLIPEIKHGANKKESLYCFFLFLVGIGLMLAFRFFGE